MYGVVLMMALSGGAATPAFADGVDRPKAERYGNHLVTQANRHGCHGCWGGCSGCWGCYGGGCHGCWGGWYSSCCGCYGGGCYGSCYGCYGGCYGSCYGGGWYGSCYGCYGAGCYGGYASAYSVAPTVVMAQAETGAAPATFTVRLPEDARLTINGQPTRATSGTRDFVTPPLELGQAYSYTLKAEAVRDGKPVTVTRDLTVRAGKDTSVSLEFPPTGVARK